MDNKELTAADALVKISSDKAPPPPVVIEQMAGMGVHALPQKPQAPTVAEFLGSQNRRFRRDFARKNRIFLPGTSKPYINTRKVK